MAGGTKKAVDESVKGTMFTIFTLLFPSLITAGVAAINSSLGVAIISIALFFYQATLLKRYIETQQA